MAKYFRTFQSIYYPHYNPRYKGIHINVLSPLCDLQLLSKNKDRELIMSQSTSAASCNPGIIPRLIG